jgi:6-pyruvoyltetrahydropterin/6-carboxytetrahydropterin synthase
MLAELITGRLDHKYLNEVLPRMNPTVDNMVVWIWEQVENYLQKEEFVDRGCRIEEIQLAETPTCWATLKRAWMTDQA